MTAGGGDLQRPLHVLLPHHVGKVRQRGTGRGGLPPERGRNSALPFQVGHQLADILHAVDGNAVGQRSLGGVGGGDEQLLHPLTGGKHGHGQHAGDGTQRPRQAQLPQKGSVLRQCSHLAGGSHDAQQDGQVVHRALLPQTGRSQIHRDAADGELGPAVFHRGPHSLPRFLYRRVRQTHHVKGR